MSDERASERMRICFVYDQLYPRSVGGMEHWFRELSLSLSGAGHDVTYLTVGSRRALSENGIPGGRLIGLGRDRVTYGATRRNLLPPLIFGIAVFRHLLRNGDRYDLVQVGSFPFFPLLAAAALARRRRFRLVVAWPEVWTAAYWRSYAGPVLGRIGWLVERACLRTRHQAICISEMHARRLVAFGHEGEPILFRGLYAGPVGRVSIDEVRPSVVYAGRFVREKGVPALVRAFAELAPSHPELRLELFGDGPQRPDVEALVRELGLVERVRVAGVVSEAEVAAAVATAACVATASEREGYGLLPVEAAARGTPTVVVTGPENASLELIHEGVNGAVAASAAPSELATAIVRVLAAGEALRESTARWFQERADELQLSRSLDRLAEELRSN
ncbi:MAG: glycosyltransferase family 4 protein [Gaiellaceae bacterium]